MSRLYANTKPFYIRDLSILRFWCLLVGGGSPGTLQKPRDDIQLTLEQPGFELHESAYMHFVFFLWIHTPVLHYPWLVESMDVEPQIQRADCKVIYGLLCGGLVPLTRVWFKVQLYKEPRDRSKSFSKLGMSVSKLHTQFALPVFLPNIALKFEPKCWSLIYWGLPCQINNESLSSPLWNVFATTSSFPVWFSGKREALR